MRGGLAILVVLLTAVGCGGGRTAPADAGPDAAPDRAEPVDQGAADEAPPEDAAPRDTALPPDGPACDPTGGHVIGSLCVIDLDCACPGTCLRPRPAPAGGACWQRCDPGANDPGTGANPTCQATETCVAGAGDTAGCLPRGTVAGDFALPLFPAPAEPASPGELGSAAITLEVGLVGQMVFSSGWATTATGAAGPVYRLFLYPGAGATVDWDKPLILDLAADAGYQAGGSYDLAATPARAQLEYHEYTRTLQTLSRDVLRTEARSGTVGLTAAGTTAGAPVQGSVTGGVVVELEAELCGESTTPCP